MTDLESLLRRDPATVFRRPVDVLQHKALSSAQKTEVLRQWERDLREQMVAEEENMPAPEPLSVALDEVLEALDSLGAGQEPGGSPTKHG
jgi:hypothetical protein